PRRWAPTCARSATTPSGTPGATAARPCSIATSRPRSRADARPSPDPLSRKAGEGIGQRERGSDLVLSLHGKAARDRGGARADGDAFVEAGARAAARRALLSHGGGFPAPAGHSDLARRRERRARRLARAVRRL